MIIHKALPNPEHKVMKMLASLTLVLWDILTVPCTVYIAPVGTLTNRHQIISHISRHINIRAINSVIMKIFKLQSCVVDPKRHFDTKLTEQS